MRLWQSSSVLKRSGGSGHTYFFPDLREQVFNSSPLSRILAVGLSYMAFIMLGCIPFITNLLRVLSWKDMDFVKYFSCICWNKYMIYTLQSVQFSCSVMSDSLWPHGLQQTRLPCLSPTPGACSNSCPLSRWFHPTISSSVIPFSSCPQSFPASGSFLVDHFFSSGGQSIGVSASASVLPMNIQDWFPLG